MHPHTQIVIDATFANLPTLTWNGKDYATNPECDYQACHAEIHQQIRDRYEVMMKDQDPKHLAFQVPGPSALRLTALLPDLTRAVVSHDETQYLCALVELIASSCVMVKIMDDHATVNSFFRCMAMVREEQNRKHSHAVRSFSAWKYTVLIAEEIGEVCEAIVKDDRDDAIGELVQVAAVCFAAYEQLRQRQDQRSPMDTACLATAMIIDD